MKKIRRQSFMPIVMNSGYNDKLEKDWKQVNFISMTAFNTVFFPMSWFPLRKVDILAQIYIPFLRKPIEQQLDVLTRELHCEWIAFNKELKQDKLPHLAFDHDTQKLSWRKLDMAGQSDNVPNQPYPLPCVQ